VAWELIDVMVLIAPMEGLGVIAATDAPEFEEA
jgi:hypothetical protein